MGFFRNIGPLEIFLILVAIMIIFGVGKLPSVGRGMGQAIKEFRTSVKDKDKDGDALESAEAKSEAESKVS